MSYEHVLCVCVRVSSFGPRNCCTCVCLCVCAYVCTWITWIRLLLMFASVLCVLCFSTTTEHTVYTPSSLARITHTRLVFQSPNTVTWLTFQFHYFAARSHVCEYVNISTLSKEQKSAWVRDVVCFCIKHCLVPNSERTLRYEAGLLVLLNCCCCLFFLRVYLSFSRLQHHSLTIMHVVCVLCVYFFSFPFLSHSVVWAKNGVYLISWMDRVVCVCLF